ncbi:hypothetical protein Leryth_003022 [Lithospermum erythrorhizon]|nr:hypothetical protein Leryth_003022 [Lithospermum erythrorhizon]
MTGYESDFGNSGRRSGWDGKGRFTTIISTLISNVRNYVHISSRKAGKPTSSDYEELKMVVTDNNNLNLTLPESTMPLLLLSTSISPPFVSVSLEEHHKSS